MDEDLTLKQKEVDIKIQELLVKQKEVTLMEKRITDMQNSAELKASQTSLHNRQIQGFTESKWQKLFEATMNGWGLGFSSGMLSYTPSIVTDTSLTTLFNKLNTAS